MEADKQGEELQLEEILTKRASTAADAPWRGTPSWRRIQIQWALDHRRHATLKTRMKRRSVLSSRLEASHSPTPERRWPGFWCDFLCCRQSDKARESIIYKTWCYIYTHTQKKYSHSRLFIQSWFTQSASLAHWANNKYISVLIYGIYFFNYMYGLHCLVTLSIISAVQQSSLQWFTDDGRAKKQ